MKKAFYNGRGAIFDLDGTLLDTLGDLAAAGNQVLARHGFAPLPEDGYRYYVGNGLRAMVRRALTASLQLAPRDLELDEALIALLLEDVSRYYLEHWSERTRLYPGVAELLAALQKRRIPFAVCSNKEDDFVQRMLRHYFPETPFAGAVGRREGIPLKPDITGAMLLAEAMGLAPRDVVFVGDTRMDMQTAGAAGMFGVGVSWGFRPREELLESGARLIVDEAADILRCFG